MNKNFILLLTLTIVQNYVQGFGYIQGSESIQKSESIQRSALKCDIIPNDYSIDLPQDLGYRESMIAHNWKQYLYIETDQSNIYGIVLETTVFTSNCTPGTYQTSLVNTVNDVTNKKTSYNAQMIQFPNQNTLIQSDPFIVQFDQMNYFKALNDDSYGFNFNLNNIVGTGIPLSVSCSDYCNYKYMD